MAGIARSYRSVRWNEVKARAPFRLRMILSENRFPLFGIMR